MCTKWYKHLTFDYGLAFGLEDKSDTHTNTNKTRAQIWQLNKQSKVADKENKHCTD